MSNLDNLLSSLEIIINELNKAGKSRSADFFSICYNEIKNTGGKLTSDAINKLSTCRAMSQYANFSLKEERLLDIIVKNAIAVKSA